MSICLSPQLIAAYHVLLRLQEPRHPPCALIYFLMLCLTHHNISTCYFDHTIHHCTVISCLSQYVKELDCNYEFRIQNYELNVENNGFEPLTPCVQGRCSSQLS